MARKEANANCVVRMRERPTSKVGCVNDQGFELVLEKLSSALLVPGRNVRVRGTAQKSTLHSGMWTHTLIAAIKRLLP